VCRLHPRILAATPTRQSDAVGLLRGATVMSVAETSGLRQRPMPRRTPTGQTLRSAVMTGDGVDFDYGSFDGISSAKQNTDAVTRIASSRLREFRDAVAARHRNHIIPSGWETEATSTMRRRFRLFAKIATKGLADRAAGRDRWDTSHTDSVLTIVSRLTEGQFFALAAKRRCKFTVHGILQSR